MACPACGHADNPPDSRFCEQCGAPLPQPVDADAARAEGAAATGAVAAPAEAQSTAIGAESASRQYPEDAETQTLTVSPTAVEGWVCACGTRNPPNESYCTECGEERPRAAPLRPGDRFGRFEIVERNSADTFAVRTEDEPQRRLTLIFRDPARVDALVGALGALAPSGEGDHAARLPGLIDHGADESRGAWLVTEPPPGEWRPLTAELPADWSEAAGVLTELLGLAERAAAQNRLLVLSPRDVLHDGGHAFVPEPYAVSWPPPAPLLADPELIAPELRTGASGPSPWPAAAYGVAATLRAVCEEALGFPAAWHKAMLALLSADPSARPAAAEEVSLPLAAADAATPVHGHRSAVLTDIGRHHPVNQDAGGVWTWTREDGVPATAAVVADGVSSGERSEEAAAIAVEVVRTALHAALCEPACDPDRIEQALREAGLEAQRRVAALPAGDERTASATTLVAAGVLGADAVGIWCGDSRAYGMTPEGVRALTRDHSWVNLVVDRGAMTLEEARRDPRAHVISRWLGASDPPRDDPGFECFRRTFVPGERLLLCSDGLYMYFDPPDGDEPALESLAYAGDGEPEGAVQRLVQAALERGGFDNITAALVAFD